MGHNTIRHKWLAAYWRWFLEAIDQKKYKKSLAIAKIMRKL